MASVVEVMEAGGLRNGAHLAGARGSESVDRDGEMDGAFAAGVRFGKRAREIEGNLRGFGHFGRPFCDGARHADLVDILESLPIGERARPAAADCDQRAACEIGGGDSGEGIGVPGSAGDEREGGPAMDARPGVGGMSDA